MLIKIISFNLTLNLLAEYHMMKTTFVKHLLYSYTLFLRVFKTQSLHSLIFDYTEYFILIYIVQRILRCVNSTPVYVNIFLSKKLYLDTLKFVSVN